MYVWTSSNTSVATVSTKGIVVTAGLVGYTQVRAADMRNLANFGTAEVGLNYNTSLHDILQAHVHIVHMTTVTTLMVFSENSKICWRSK